jgi:hypothetical protein
MRTLQLQNLLHLPQIPQFVAVAVCPPAPMPPQIEGKHCQCHGAPANRAAAAANRNVP